MQQLITLSNREMPVIREEGGGMTNTGDAIILVAPDWTEPKPLFRPRNPHCYGPGAGYVVAPGMIVLSAQRRRDEITFLSRRVVDVLPTRDEWNRLVVEVEPIEPPIREWNLAEGLDGLPAPFRVAAERTLCYHCRCATHWDSLAQGNPHA